MLNVTLRRHRSSLAALAAVVAWAAVVTAGEDAAEDVPKRFPAEWHWAQNQEQLEACYALVGKKAPNPEVGGWMRGNPGPGGLKGKIVVIDFWATWCRPCIDAIPHTNELMHRYADQGVSIIGICSSRGADRMASIVNTHDMQYPTTQDVYNQTAVRYGVKWVPYLVIIDREGVVRGAGLQPERVEDAILALLEEQPAPGAQAQGDDAEPESEVDESDKD